MTCKGYTSAPRNEMLNMTHTNMYLNTGDGTTAVRLQDESAQDNFMDKMIEKGWVDTRTTECGREKYLWFIHPGIDIPEHIQLDEGIQLVADGTALLVPPSRDPDGNYCTFDDPDVPVAPMPKWLIDLIRRALGDDWNSNGKAA